MNKIVKFEKSPFGVAVYVSFFNRVHFYTGFADVWALGFEIDFHAKSFTFNILNVYFGVEIWYKE
jgi:hypothetical protein